MNTKLLFAIAASAAMNIVAASAANAATPAQCDSYATQYADQNTHPVAQTAGGALFGAGAGAAFCALAGNKNIGACAGVGAGIGATVGVVRSSEEWKANYSTAYNQCLGVSPQPVYSPYVPAVGTQAWYQECEGKYKSFNPSTGYYLGYDGQYHVCQLP